MGRREQNKEEKRTRIIAAARHIISSEGIDCLTMRHLAEVARVSPRTPYNLFNSKTDILFLILLEGLEPWFELEPVESEGLAIAGLLDRLQRIPGNSAENQEFFRSVHWAIMRSDDMESKEFGRKTVETLITSQVTHLLARKELRDDCDIHALSRHLSILLAAILGMWADAQLTLKEALAHTRHAWINSLIPQARGKSLQYLREEQAIRLPRPRSRQKTRVA